MNEPNNEAEQPLQYEEPAAEPPKLADAAPEEPEAPEPAPVKLGIPEGRVGGAPSWVVLPETIRFPPHRVKVFFRIPSRWTFAPTVGIPLRRPMTEDEQRQAGPSGLWRQIIVWPLSGGDTKLAAGRARSDGNLIAGELSKQMIRAIDGHVVTWDGLPGPGNVDELWEQLGGKCQTLVRQLWNQLHSLEREQLATFFESYIEARS